MKKIFLLLTVFILGTTCFAQNDARYIPSQVRLEKLELYLDEVNEAYHIPGMGFFITSPEKTLLEKAYGECTNLDRQFYIGSMSKSYTAFCVMQLVEKGLVKLEDDISVYLPDYHFSKPVTVLALLNHTSGFDTHAKLHNVKLTDSYGKYEYANVNYDLLGKIIEAVSGQTYEDYIQQNVFEPLGMADSKANAWMVKDSQKLLKGNRNYFGFFKQGEAVFPVEKSWFHEPAGYIASTPHDHAKYLRMYLNGGKTGGLENSENQLLSSQNINTMWYKNVSEGDKQYDLNYGMGWNCLNWKGQTIIFHAGQVENGITFQYILPGKRLAVCFMVNASDYLVMNSLMNDVVFETIEILNGEEPEKINHKKYVLFHIGLNVIYCLIIALSLLVLIMAIKSKLNMLLTIAGGVVWPVLLLSFTQLFISTPLWVVRLFVTDLYIVLITGAVLAFAGGVIYFLKMIFAFE